MQKKEKKVNKTNNNYSLNLNVALSLLITIHFVKSTDIFHLHRIDVVFTRDFFHHFGCCFTKDCI